MRENKLLLNCFCYQLSCSCKQMIWSLSHLILTKKQETSQSRETSRQTTMHPDVRTGGKNMQTQHTKAEMDSFEPMKHFPTFCLLFDLEKNNNPVMISGNLINWSAVHCSNRSRVWKSSTLASRTHWRYMAHQSDLFPANTCCDVLTKSRWNGWFVGNNHQHFPCGVWTCKAVTRVECGSAMRACWRGDKTQRVPPS